LRAGDTFWDIGANIGSISLLASRIVGSDGRVFSFEPLPDAPECWRTPSGRFNVVWEMPIRSQLLPTRFPPPWTVEELDACFVVIDSAGQKLAYI
jgi:precorrin-6B methylase 2